MLGPLSACFPPALGPHALIPGSEGPEAPGCLNARHQHSTAAALHHPRCFAHLKPQVPDEEEEEEKKKKDPETDPDKEPGEEPEKKPDEPAPSE